jgi:flagellar hook-associated protein 2
MRFGGHAGAARIVTLTVSAPKPDRETIKGKVKSFVDQYNSTVDFINTKLNEKCFANPTNETDAIKGVLQSGGPLRSMLNQLRVIVSSYSADGTAQGLSTLADIGISTGATTGGGLNQDALHGKLTLDDKKLASALDSNLGGVRKLLGEAFGKGGFSRRIGDLLHPLTQATGALDARISAEDANRRQIATRLSEMDRRLQAKQDRLKAQFSGMEKSLSSRQTQGNGSWTDLRARAVYALVARNAEPTERA